jgi:UDP:flavonoid glycosyltransferase YjiC (YdhE family)
MKKVIFVSELGGGFGHLSKLSLLAGPLTETGCKVFAGLANGDHTRRIGRDLQVESFSLPAWPSPIRREGPALNYSEILARIGYCIPDRLSGMVSRWVEIFERIKPELVIGDHAPTALITARAMGIKAIRLGTGFQSPPAENPLPALLGSADKAVRLRARMDSLVLLAINRALDRFDVTPATELREALSVDGDYITTFQETDHYEHRRETAYWGPLYTLPGRPTADWPGGSGKRVFVYVNSTTPCLKEICQSLVELDYSALVFARGISKADLALLSRGRVTVVDTPVDLPLMLETADLVICNGSHGMTSAALLSRCRVLTTPLQTEQLMCSRRLSALRLARTISARSNRQAWREAIENSLASEASHSAVVAFAEKYAHYDPKHTAREIVGNLADRF